MDHSCGRVRGVVIMTSSHGCIVVCVCVGGGGGGGGGLWIKGPQ